MAVEQTRFKVRGQDAPQPYYGQSIQPQRLATVLRHTPPGARVLDLGTGRGAYVRTLRRKEFEAFGLDAAFYSEWTSQTVPWFTQASAHSLPFVRDAFHTTICFEVLEHCPMPEVVLAGIARCTSRRLILSVPNCDTDNLLREFDLALAHWTDVTHCNFFTKQSIQDLLVGCGYRVVEMSDCYRVSPNDYYWESVRLPKLVAKVIKRVFRALRLAEAYWSSILLVAEVPAQAGP